MRENPTGEQTQPPLLDILATVKVLWQRRRLVLATAALLVFGAVIYLVVAEKSDANAEVTDLLNSRIGGLQQAVTEAEHAVEVFKVANNIFDSGAGGTVVQSQIDQLTVQLLAAQELARQAASKYEQAIAAGRTPRSLIDLAGVLSSAAADRLREEYNQRSTEYASAQAVLGAKHPTRIKLAAELARVEALMVREVERITLELKASRDLADSNVKKIEGDISALRGESNLPSQKAVELRQLERNAEASRQVLEQFQKRSEETSQFQDLQLSDARVISIATPPVQATWPKPALLLTVSALLGIALGSAIALFLGPLATDADETRKGLLLRFLARRATSKRTIGAPIADQAGPAAPSAVLDILAQAEPVAAPPAPSPPASAANREPLLPTLANLRTRFRAPTSSTMPTRAEIDASRLEVALYPQSPFALQIATLIGRLLGKLDPAKTPYVLLMSSVGDRFEKSRLGYNMATGLQRVGASVVVVDLDPLVAPEPAGQGASSLQLAMSGHLPLRRTLSTDPFSGLATIVDEGSAAWDAAKVNRLLTELAPAFKFIVVIGKPISARAYDHTFSAVADQEIFALTLEEEKAHKDEEITSATSAESRSWRSLVVIDHGTEEPQPGPAAKRPDVQAAIAETRRTSRYAELT